MELSLSNLPIELQTLILKFTLNISRRFINSYFPIQNCWKLGRSIYYESEISPSSRRIPRIEQDLRSAFLFPFNVAAVCQLWHDIVVRIPEYWTRVVFDVASDPTPFLDAFSWSKNLGRIEVFIFNSTSNAKDVDKDLENARVAAITQALKPHTHRCKFIIFHLTYSSSLPPPNIFLANEAAHLEDLTLDCRIDDIDLGNHTFDHGLDIRLWESFPKLETLSLTGFWFFHLVQHSTSSWLADLRCAQRVSLYISQFTFPKNGRYSLATFLDGLTTTITFTSIYFTDISLDYLHDYCAPDPDELDYVLSSNIHFDCVSKDFIAQLNSITIFEVDECLSFKDCEIPYFARDPGGETLRLQNIIDDDKSQSLRNIVNAWMGHEIKFYSCPSFNDKFLRWLSSKQKSYPWFPDTVTYPAAYSKVLTIDDCSNFSLTSLQGLIEVRNSDENYHWPLILVSVDDSRDVLTEEDKEWFKEMSGTTNVSWRDRKGVSYEWGGD